MYSRLEGGLGQYNYYFAQKICLGRNGASAGASISAPGMNLTNQDTKFGGLLVRFRFHWLEEVSTPGKPRRQDKPASVVWRMTSGNAGVSDCHYVPLSSPLLWGAEFDHRLLLSLHKRSEILPERKDKTNCKSLWLLVWMPAFFFLPPPSFSQASAQPITPRQDANPNLKPIGFTGVFVSGLHHLGTLSKREGNDHLPALLKVSMQNEERNNLITGASEGELKALNPRGWQVRLETEDMCRGGNEHKQISFAFSGRSCPRESKLMCLPEHPTHLIQVSA